MTSVSRQNGPESRRNFRPGALASVAAGIVATALLGVLMYTATFRSELPPDKIASLRNLARASGVPFDSFRLEEEITSRWGRHEYRPEDIEAYLRLLNASAPTVPLRTLRMRLAMDSLYLRKTPYRSRARAALRSVVADERARPDPEMLASRNLFHSALARLGDPDWKVDARADLASATSPEMRDDLRNLLEQYADKY